MPTVLPIISGNGRVGSLNDKTFPPEICDFFAADLSIAILVVILLIAILRLGIAQSADFVIERFGKYARTLNALCRVSVLERQLDQQRISVITKDNVEVTLEARVFFRVTDAARSVYRIRNINDALVTASSSIVRSAAGKLELDELQSSREAMNKEIAHNLHSAAEVWGIEIIPKSPMSLWTRRPRKHSASS